MAKLEQIDRSGPVLIDPYQYDMDCWVTTKPVAGVSPIVLAGEEAKTFYQWVADYWLSDFESGIQSLATHKDYGDLLTTWLPLVTLREDLCCRGMPRENESFCALLDKLRLLTREWRSAGVDTVYMSGCDLRKMSVE